SLDQVQPKRLRYSALKLAARLCLVQLHFASQEVVLGKAAEHEVRVRDCRILTPAPVAHRARHRASALRTHLQRARLVDAGYRAATGADRLDLDHRDEEWVPVQRGFAGDLESAFVDQRDVRARPSHIEADDMLVAGLLADERARHRPTSWTRHDCLDGFALRRSYAHDPARGLAHEERPGIALLEQGAFDVLEIRADDRH